MPPQTRASCILIGALVFCGVTAVSAQAPQGPAITVNADPAESQEIPSVAIAQDGTGVFAYTADRYGTKVARWLDAAGSPQGPEPRLGSRERLRVPRRRR